MKHGRVAYHQNDGTWEVPGSDHGRLTLHAKVEHGVWAFKEAGYQPRGETKWEPAYLHVINVTKIHEHDSRIEYQHVATVRVSGPRNCLDDWFWSNVATKEV